MSRFITLWAILSTTSLIACTTDDIDPCEGSPVIGEWCLLHPVIATGGDIDSPEGAHSCAVSRHKELKCWGSNASGQLGIEDTTDQHTPVLAGNLTDIVGVAAGPGITCAIDSTEAAWCFGNNSHGQLGNGTTDNSSRPVKVLDRVRTIESGWHTTCAVRTDGSVWCWGRKPGINTVDIATTPEPVPTLPSITKVSIGTNQVCAVTHGGQVFCWGDNTRGSLGDGTVTTTPSPVQVSGLETAIDVHVGEAFACACLKDGRIGCWGRNDNGYLGSGDYQDTHTPIQVTTVIDGVFIDGHTHYTAVITSSGTVLGWGDLSHFAMPDTPFTPTANSPQTMSTLFETIQYSGAAEHGCALRGDGTVWCFGKNQFGQLGTGNTDDSIGNVQRILDV